MAARERRGKARLRLRQRTGRQQRPAEARRDATKKTTPLVIVSLVKPDPEGAVARDAANRRFRRLCFDFQERMLEKTFRQITEARPITMTGFDSSGFVSSGPFLRSKQSPLHRELPRLRIHFLATEALNLIQCCPSIVACPTPSASQSLRSSVARPADMQTTEEWKAEEEALVVAT